MIRQAREYDVPVIHTMNRAHAEYEKALPELVATEADLREALFGPDPAVFAHLAFDDDTGEPVGFALWYVSYSAWRGVHGIFLEDLYVKKEARGDGYGKALLAELAALCVERGYERFEWTVQDRNVNASNFYRAMGADPMDDWTLQRLTGDALSELAGAAA